MLPNGIHNVYIQRPHPLKGVEYRPAGRFLINRGSLHVLEDHLGVMNHLPTGPVDEVTLMSLQHPPQGVRTASHSSLRAGQHPELIPEANLQPMPPPVELPSVGVQPVQVPRPSVWHYTRAGHDRPHLLEYAGGKALLDGNQLSDEEVSTIINNVRQKTGKICYVDPETRRSVGAATAALQGLRKADEMDSMDPQAALQHLDRRGGDDPDTREAVAALRRHIMEDSMNPGLGNKYAYEQFRKKAPPGVWASIDANSLKHLNDTQGHDAGDQYIRAFGGALRQAVDSKTSKAFRSGGDEYVVHFPDAPTAYTAIRGLREHLEGVPPIGGTHRLSFSAGLGHDFGSADQALYAAKARKAAGLHDPGQTPNYAHSHLQGAEGPVPLNPAELPLSVPEIPPAPPEASAAPQPVAH